MAGSPEERFLIIARHLTKGMPWKASTLDVATTTWKVTQLINLQCSGLQHPKVSHILLNFTPFCNDPKQCSYSIRCRYSRVPHLRITGYPPLLALWLTQIKQPDSVILKIAPVSDVLYMVELYTSNYHKAIIVQMIGLTANMLTISDVLIRFVLPVEIQSSNTGGGI